MRNMHVSEYTVLRYVKHSRELRCCSKRKARHRGAFVRSQLTNIHADYKISTRIVKRRGISAGFNGNRLRQLRALTRRSRATRLLSNMELFGFPDQTYIL